MLLIKTRKDLAAKAMDRLKSLHPYSVPEAIEISIESGLKSYLDWLDAETST